MGCCNLAVRCCGTPRAADTGTPVLRHVVGLTLIALAIALVEIADPLVGCATEDSVLALRAFADTLRTSRGTLPFTDDVQQVRPERGPWNLPTLADQTLKAEYGSVWDSSGAAFALHVAEIEKLGLKRKTVFDRFSDIEVREFASEQRAPRRPSASLPR
jgi:hypothetical protein